MSGDGDKTKRRRGAFARPDDPLDLAPLPFSARRKSASPPRVEVPPPKTRPPLDEPMEEDGTSSVEETLKTALGADADDSKDAGDTNILDNLQRGEDVDDATTVPTPRPLSARATVATVRKRTESIPEDLPPSPTATATAKATARVSVAQVRVSTHTPTHIDTIPDNLPPASPASGSGGGQTTGLANLVEVNNSEPSTEPSYSHSQPNDHEVSFFDSHSDDSLFDLAARQHHPEYTEDPPSDVVEFGPISAHKDLIVREEPKRTFSERPRREDATVFTDEQRVARKKGTKNHAWWERDTPSATPTSAPRPSEEERKTWRTPGQLDLRQRTARRERRNRLARLAAMALGLLLITAGAYALMQEPVPSDASNGASPEVELEVLDEVTVPAEAVPVDVEQPTEQPVVPVEPPVEEPPVEVEPEVEEPEVDEPVAATEALEEQAHKALYETGVLVVSSNPRALVWVDGERVGYTPIQALELEPGTHRIKATVPGRPPKYQSVRVDPGGAHQVPFDF